MQGNFTKRLQNTYIIALSLIALLSIGSQYLVRTNIESQTADSRVINVAGRQRMLSQKLTKTALILVNHRDSLADRAQYLKRLKELKETLDLWTRSHIGLQAGNVSMQLPVLENDSIKLAFEKITPSYQAMVSASNAILDSLLLVNEEMKASIFNQNLALILESEGGFLKQMNEIVSLFEREAQRKITRLKNIELALLVLTLLTLVAEAFLIFMPANRAIKSYILKVQNYNEELATSEEEIRQNLEEIHAMHENLLQSQIRLKQLSMIAENTSDCLIITDKEGRAVWVNEGFTKLTYYRLEDIEGKKPGNVLQGKDTAPQTVHRLREAIRKAEPILEEIINYDKFGNPYWTRILINPVFENDELVNFIAVQNNITERKDTQKTLEAQKKQLEVLYKDVTSSINFAKRIQKAVLPTAEEITQFLPNNFIIYKPKNIVSGDFYWFHATEQHLVIVVADCTGHGVSGAFMSLIGTDLLNQIVIGKKEVSPSKILKALNEEIKIAFKQDKILNYVGIDLAICVVENYESGKNDKKVRYAGIKSPLVYVQKNQIRKLEASSMILGSSRQENTNFDETEIVIDAPTEFYMFSDGYHDQFGGGENQKLKKKYLQELFFQIHQLDMDKQGILLNEWFETWKGQEKQTDDVLVLGFRINP
jgi:PAS domain S-box-containing protein